MKLLYYLSLYLHLLAVIVWIGGMAFIVLIYVPMIRKEKMAINHPFVLASFRRFRMVSWAALGVMLFTGLLLLFFYINSGENFNWNVFVLKGGIVTLILVLTVIHDSLAEKTIRIIESSKPKRSGEINGSKDRLIGRVIFLLGLVVVFIALLLSDRVN